MKDQNNDKKKFRVRANQTEKLFCITKETINTMKKPTEERENICEQCAPKQVNIQNIETAHITQYQKEKKLKNRQKNLNGHFSRRHMESGQQAHEEMLDIINY